MTIGITAKSAQVHETLSYEDLCMKLHLQRELHKVKKNTPRGIILQDLEESVFYCWYRCLTCNKEFKATAKAYICPYCTTRFKERFFLMETNSTDLGYIRLMVYNILKATSHVDKIKIVIPKIRTAYYGTRPEGKPLAGVSSVVLKRKGGMG